MVVGDIAGRTICDARSSSTRGTPIIVVHLVKSGGGGVFRAKRDNHGAPAAIGHDDGERGSGRLDCGRGADRKLMLLLLLFHLLLLLFHLQLKLLLLELELVLLLQCRGQLVVELVRLLHLRLGLCQHQGRNPFLLLQHQLPLLLLLLRCSLCGLKGRVEGGAAGAAARGGARVPGGGGAGAEGAS